MRVASKLATIAVTVAATCFIACSDDDDKPTTDMQVADMPVTPAEGGTDGVAPTEGGTDGTAPTGACSNAADSAAVQKQYGGKDITAIVSEQVSCLGAGSQAQIIDCIIQAVGAATNNEVSDPCIKCFAESALCSVMNCPMCISAPTGAECVACRCGGSDAGINCVAGFEACAGVKSTTTCP